MDSKHNSIMHNEFGEEFIGAINGDTFSKTQSTLIFDSLLTQALWQENSYHIIVGTDSGLLIEYIVNRGIAKNSCYLFIELPQYIEMIRPQLNEEWKQVLKFCTPDEWNSGFDQDNSASYFYNDNVFVHYSAAVTIGNNVDYQQLKTSIDFMFKNKCYENSAGLGNREFIACQLNNVSHNSQSVSLLDNAFDGKTCVILGGGPSLDNDLDWVAKHKDDLIIIAVSRISKKLQNYGLIPHFVCAIDPQQVSYDVSKEIENYPADVILLNGYHVIPKLLSQWSGKKLYIGDCLPWKSNFNSPTHFHEGPTVVNAALIAAVNMGFKQILLSGTDLCYGSDGKTHASGSFEATRQLQLSRDSHWMETYDGTLAETIVPLILTGKYLSKHALYAKEHDCDVINLSKHALKLESITYKATEDVVITPFNESSSNVLSRLVPHFNLSKMQAHIKSLENEFQAVKQDLTQIGLLSSEAIELTKKGFNSKLSSDREMLSRRKIEKIETKITSKYGYLNHLLKTLAFRAFAKILVGGSAKTLDDVALAQRNVIYYEAYISGVSMMRELMEPAQVRLAIYSEAYLSHTPNVKTLWTYWKNQQEFGCGATFIKHRADLVNTFNEEDIFLLENINIANVDYQCDRNREQLKVTFNFNGVADKIRKLFTNNDVIALNKFVEQIRQENQDEQQRMDHIALAMGYICILKEDFSSAANELKQVSEKVINKSDQEQLVNLLIKLNQIDQAQSLLAILSEEVPRLLRVYGQVLAHNELYDLAVDTYSRYLDTFNSDLDAWIEIGNIFISLNIIESALMAFEFVLSIEPTHEQAKQSVVEIKQFMANKSS